MASHDSTTYNSSDTDSQSAADSYKYHGDTEMGHVTTEEDTIERRVTCSMCACATQTEGYTQTEDFSKIQTGSNESALSDLAAVNPSSGSRFRNTTSIFLGGAALMQVKTETRKQWSSNRRKGIQVTTKYFYQEIDSSWTVAMVIVCFFTAGLIDSIAYRNWGTYVSMQTGNSILIAIRLSDLMPDPHPLSYLKNLISLGSFGLGALFFNILHRFPGGVSNPKAPLHRWTLFVAFGVQSSILITVSILATTGVISGESVAANTSSTGLSNWYDLMAIAFLAFEASGQVCLSRVTKINDLPTIVISTIYHDFIADTLNTRREWRESATLKDFLMTQKKQVRRVSCIITLFLGALVGDFIYSSTNNIQGTLWLAAGAKLCICLGWCLWKKKTVTETVVTKQDAEKAAEEERKKQESEKEGHGHRLSLGHHLTLGHHISLGHHNVQFGNHHHTA